MIVRKFITKRTKYKKKHKIDNYTGEYWIMLLYTFRKKFK